MSGSAPLVSVIMACRNEARWIRASIDSVLAQSHSEIELLVVDDGSTDATVGIIDSIRDPRLRLIQQEWRGACAARNVGLRLASGVLIQVLDGDDLLAPDKIKHQVKRWQRDGDSSVYFGPYACFTQSPSDARFQPRSNWCDQSGHSWLLSAWSGGGMMAPHAWLTPAPLARAAGEWDETLLQNQDGEYFSRVLLASSGVRYCAEALSYYRVTTKHSISQRTDYDARASRLHSTCRIVDRLMAVDDGAATRAACGNALEELMFLTYPQFPDLSAIAATRLRDLGGGDGSQPFRGPLFKLASQMIGWRPARRIQRRWRRMIDMLFRPAQAPRRA